MLRRVAGYPVAVVFSTAVLILLAHVPQGSDALSDEFEQAQVPGVGKQLNNLLAWSIGEISFATRAVK
jgi:hypothetical protein